jgi:hypothetical protein
MSDFRDFLGRDEVKNLITTSVNYQNEDPGQARPLLIFKTFNQQTWLIATDRRIYCVLDDRRKAAARMQWSMAISGARAAQIRRKDYRGRTGLLDIGEKKNWLYSEDLFREIDVVEAVKKLIG